MLYRKGTDSLLELFQNIGFCFNDSVHNDDCVVGQKTVTIHSKGELRS